MGIVKISLKAVFMTGLFFASMSVAKAGELNCVSGHGAPVYPMGRGQWRMNAEVSSDFTLKNAVLKNAKQRNQGSTTKRVVYDRNITDARLFMLEQDTFCKYEFVVPRGFYTSNTRFNADLIITCDDMYDATATLSCSRK